ncbi:MAG: PspC domain-containing protein [Spirosomataceae bacterium]
MKKQLKRNSNNKMIGGVAAGLADYFDIDVTVVRLILVAGIFLPFPVVIPYLVAWAVMPNDTPNTVTIA